MEKTINIRGHQIAYTTEGDPNNSAIILLHDLASHRGIWQKTIESLSSKYFCLAIDLLGFGASDKPENGDYSVTSQGQRILSLADKLDLQKFSIIGHSMGGQIGLVIASTISPQRIEKLVLVNSIVTGKYSPEVEKTMSQAVRIMRRMAWVYRLGLPLVNIPMVGKSIFHSWFYDGNALPFKSWENERRQACNPACHISMDDSLISIQSLDLTQQLRKISAKTLIITGKQDGLVPQDQSLLAQTLIPNSDLAVFEKCGHYPMLEKPVNFQKALAILL